MQQQLNNLFAALGQGGAQQISAGPFLFVMAVSLLSSLFISYLYVHFYSNRATGSQVHRAFPLLGISIAAIFVTIQFSLPLSLGLLGALSIVRFRTPIKEPEEIGFVMLVIAVSLATATFRLAFVGIILVVAVCGLFIQAFTRRLTGRTTDGTLVISIPVGTEPADGDVIAALLRKRLRKARLESVSRTDHETVMSYNFEGIAEGSLAGLQLELNASARDCTYNMFFNTRGAL
jgi:Domain of unknown function (DUF4956)